MNANDVLMLDPDEVNFKELDDNTLKEIILKDENRFISVHALTELSTRQIDSIEHFYQKIISENIGDKYVLIRAFQELCMTTNKIPVDLIDPLIKEEDIFTLSEIIEEINFYIEECSTADKAKLKKIVPIIKQYDISKFEHSFAVEKFLKYFE